MSEIREIVAEIAGTLDAVPDCGWFQFWHAGMEERLGEADPGAVALWTLKGFRRLADDVAALNGYVRQLETALAAKPAHARTVLPEREIVVTNPTQQAVLYLMGSTGLGRSWRLVRCVAQVRHVGEATVRDALTALNKAALIAPYRYQGRIARYSYKRGGGRRSLYVLGEDGRLWHEANYGPPVASEFNAAVSRHRGVQHVIDVLEARDLLRELDMEVSDEPEPLLFDEAEAWGKRAEPDLVLHHEGEVWPVEVQRDVRPRYTSKWAKTLALAGRLALVLETRREREQQVGFLRQEATRLPPGVVLLTSLEALRDGSRMQDWDRVEMG